MKIEVGKYYETSDGRKVMWCSNEGFYCGHIMGESRAYYWTINGNFIDATKFGESDVDLKDTWEDEQEEEEFDVANMWVGVTRFNGGLECTSYYHSKELAQYIDEELKKYMSPKIAIVTVSDWQDICSGKRKLIVGEGLDD